MQSSVGGVLGVVVVTLLVSGCSGSDGTRSEAPTTQAPSSVAPVPTPTPTAPTLTPPSSGTVSAAPTSSTPKPSTPKPSTPKPSPSVAPPTPAGPSRALRRARRDVASITPQLESYYRDREYPVDLAQVRQTIGDSGVSLSAGNAVAGYAYDGDAVEFTLCVESTSGAWASYDTAPMTLQESGETGGCP